MSPAGAQGTASRPLADEAVSKATLAELAFGHTYAPHRDDNPLRVNLNRLRTLVEPSGLRVELEGGYRIVTPDGFLYIRAQRHDGERVTREVASARWTRGRNVIAM